MKTQAFKPEQEDPGFLVAKGKFSGSAGERESQEKNHRSKLANAIYMAITNHGYANIRAIGTSAIANAVRSIASATDRCKKQNVSLLWELTMDKGNLGPMRESGHIQDVKAYSFKIQHFKTLEENNE